MNLKLENYLDQKQYWPEQGRHILAQYDSSSVVVYQAYKPEIGLFAAKHDYFGGDFSYTRMSWIKPNFLWMMYRCGWATKVGQEVVLAIRLRREFFDELLIGAFPSTNVMGLPDEEWKRKVEGTDVRLQWDPDHDPYGNKEKRRAIQLGLRNRYLEPFKGSGIISVENITEFVEQQRRFVESRSLDKLLTPSERVYPLDRAVSSNLLAD